MSMIPFGFSRDSDRTLILMYLRKKQLKALAEAEVFKTLKKFLYVLDLEF